MNGVQLRRVGATHGKVAKLPATMAELLVLAATKLGPDFPAQRIFNERGDEYDDEDGVELIQQDEVIYVSCGEDFPTAESAAFSTPLPAAAVETPPAESPPAAPQPAPAFAR